MKVDYNAHRTARAQHEALDNMNDAVRNAREAMLDELPMALRKKFYKALHDARLAVMRDLSIAVPADTDILDRDQRLRFNAALTIDQRITIAKRICAEIKRIATAQGLPDLADLEDTRHMQIEGCAMCTTEEDVHAVRQMTHDLADNHLSTFRSSRDARRRLSGKPAVPRGQKVKAP